MSRLSLARVSLVCTSLIRPLLVVVLIPLLGITPGASEPALAQAGIAVTGQANPDLASFDDMMLGFLKEHQVPGAALAVTRHGRLVYSRGFGVADRDGMHAVTPAMLFRIASISKPITSAAILRLIEQGRLKLDDRAFAFLNMRPGQKGDDRLNDVTVRHLLQHTGGWDRDKSFDPMFRSVAAAKA